MKFFSFAFGCRVNEAEKEIIDREMIKEGFIFDEKNPDVYLINTCAVTHKGEREARNLVYQIRKKFPNTKIVITGCAATYWLKNNLYQNLPFDLIIDNQSKNLLPQIIKNNLASNPKGSNTNINNFSKFLASKRLLVKIQDGCQYFCSYCIVPYLRGLPQSIKTKRIVDYILQNQENISEVILTAINTAAFGQDTGENLINLVNQIIKKTKIPRLSFGSIHPRSITLQFINFYQKILTENRLVNFFHIPIQSGSNTILNLMKRNYTVEAIEEKLNHLHKINPLAFLATDVIVGFLGEDEKEFEKTYQFLEKSPFCRFHVFRFSKRKNTSSYYLAKKIKEPDEKTKKFRAQTLIQLSQKKFQKFLEKNLGRKTSALVLSKEIEDCWEGLLDNQLPVLIKKTKKIAPGEIVKIKVIKKEKNFLLTSLIK